MHVCSSLSHARAQLCHLPAGLRNFLSLDHWRRTNRCSPSSPEDPGLRNYRHSSEAVSLHTYYSCPPLLNTSESLTTSLPFATPNYPSPNNDKDKNPDLEPLPRRTPGQCSNDLTLPAAVRAASTPASSRVQAMSGDVTRPSAEPRQTAAADVTFSSYADGRRPGASGSLAESQGSGEKWIEKGERLKERFLTPDRRSEEGSGEEDGSEKKRSSRIKKSGGGGGFLRDSIFGNGTLLSTEKSSDRKEGNRKLDHVGLQAENKRLAGSRLSGDSSTRSSPLSREVSINQSTQNDAHDPPTESRPPTMDPAQLVQMALSLSESRKRNTSGSLPVPIAVPRARNISGTQDKYGTVRTRGSDRARSASRFDPSPASSSHSRDRQSTPSASAIDDNVLYTFSPATLARAEKTRKYFELASEHRRLLEYLPPLKPDAQATGNYTFESRSSPGYAQPEIQRVRSDTLNRHELGRQYNPLQILRNRRLRNRERRPLTVPPELFEDTQRVATWLDDVGEAARQPAYRSSDDIVHLPHYSHEADGLDGSNGTGKGHRRTGTASTVITRPENEWTIEPTERLADTYWTEQGDNKMLLENRRRQAIFPGRPRPSVNESRKSDELVPNQYKDSPMEATDKEPQREEAPPRKHRHLLSLHKADRIRHNKLSLLRRSASASSGSSDDGRKPRPAARSDGTIDSSAPLNRHMDALITKELRGNTSSPDLDSPDHWDSKHTPFPTRGEHRNPNLRANSALSVPATVTAQRSKSADGRLAQLAEIDRARFSFDSSPPDSPAVADFMPSLAMDLSPPSKQAPSGQKHKRRVLPVFRSKSKDRNTTEGKDFAFPSDSDPSREPSGNAIDPTRLSAEYARPIELHRHQTSESMRSSLHRRGPSRTNTTSDGSIKEPGSTVGRFFKGGRLAELVRTGTDRRGRRDKEGSVTDASVIPSDASDTEGSVGEPSLTIGSPHDSEPSPRTSIDRARGKKGLHTANLPTFKSAAGREKPINSRLTPVISRDGEDDHIGRQAAAHRGASRSPRIDRLLPPRINLPDDSDFASTHGFPSETSDVVFAEPNRKSYGFLSPKKGAAPGSNVSFNTSNPAKQNSDYPVTGLTKLGANGARRHWSISDRGMQDKQRQDLLKTHRVSPRDIARARALILASGVKAHNLVLRANNQAIPAPRFLAAAARTASVDTPQVPLKETHLRAAIVLSSHLDKSLESLSQARQAYQSNTSNGLHTRQADLKSLVADKLTHTVHNSSDEADAFGVRLTTEQTLRIKQVDDAVDEILRMRRRQFRLMRRAGFKLLEWLVLGLMWWVWFVVVCWNSVRKVIVGIVKMLKWLFSF
jgi:hypothetical protein